MLFNGMKVPATVADSDEGWVMVPQMGPDGKYLYDGDTLKTERAEGEVEILTPSQWSSHIAIPREHADALYMMISEQMTDNPDLTAEDEEFWKPIIAGLNGGVLKARPVFVMFRRDDRGDAGHTEEVKAVQSFYTEAQAHFTRDEYTDAIVEARKLYSEGGHEAAKKFRNENRERLPLLLPATKGFYVEEVPC